MYKLERNNNLRRGGFTLLNFFLLAICGICLRSNVNPSLTIFTRLRSRAFLLSTDVEKGFDRSPHSLSVSEEEILATFRFELLLFAMVKICESIRTKVLCWAQPLISTDKIRKTTRRINHWHVTGYLCWNDKRWWYTKVSIASKQSRRGVKKASMRPLTALAGDAR